MGQDCLELSLKDLFNERVQEELRPAITRVKLGQQTDFEFSWTNKNQKQVFSGTFVPQFDNSGSSGFITIMRNVTETRRQSTARFKQQDSKALRTLAGGVAHEFNNLLTVILGNTELQRIALKKTDDNRHRSLDNILQASIQAKELSHQLLLFSGLKASKKHVLDLPKTIVSILKKLSPLNPTHIEIKSNLTLEQCSIFASPTQIQIILENLFHNSVQALSEKLETEKEEAEKKNEVIRIECRKRDSKWVRLTIQDNGPGLHPDIQQQVFLPFFTTKELGGTPGLGLAVVKSLMENHKGQIHLESVPGQGCALHLDFPLHLPVPSECSESKD